MPILNPAIWGWVRISGAVTRIGSAPPEEYWPAAQGRPAVPAVRRIGLDDLRAALAAGARDFAANRTDIVFLCLIYPLIGLVLARIAFGYDMLPLLFPLASGFALVGPIAAIGLNELSRRREQDPEVGWTAVFGVFRSPSVGGIALLSLLLVEIFALWLLVAHEIYKHTLGPNPPVSLGAFLHDVFATGAGWAMIGLGCGTGFLFAVAVLAISVVSFPMLLDRNVGVNTAVGTSLRAVARNPDTMAAWGFIIAGGLVVGSLPFLLGLAVVLPVLGHASWHLYRRLVPR